ncbi:MAG TPA: HAMP domain-containing sensor histidine kinase [Tepidisphaeraceae bacterium]
MAQSLAKVGRARGWSQRLGLQGKLIICFMMLLVAALGGSHFVFLRESRAALLHGASQRALCVAQTLAMAGRIPLDDVDKDELSKMAREFVKNEEIVNVAFADASGRVLAAFCPDPDFHWQDLTPDGRVDPQGLMKPRQGKSKVLGSYVTVTAPVVRTIPNHGPEPRMSTTRLVGYVTLSTSLQEEEAGLHRVYGVLVMVGCGVLLLTFPAVYALVRRIFLPIRQLVNATNSIAAGDLDSRVAIDRPDLIGTLARSFNEMVKQIKRQRQDLANANHDLEEKVKQRTSQYEAANKRLKVEIAEKEDFLRAVSHDLNAPLRNISGMATMLLMKSREKFDTEVIHRLERIQQNVQIETDLIAELLELSRIKTRRQKMEPVDIEKMVHEIGGMFENDLKSKRIELILDTPLPMLLCERARLRQVFQNLIDNSIKYMGEGLTREIRVGCIVRPSEAEFYVRDTGIGIDAEDKDKVFFVFRRGRNTQTQNVPGKGVGLASVKSIIETYEGSIWVESEIGQGSTFRFTINGKFVPGANGPARPGAKAA